MRPKLVLFDIDGTLINSAGAGRVAMERAFHEVYGVDGISDRAAGVRFAGRTDPIILEHVSRAIGIEAAEYLAHRKRLELAFLEALRRELARPDPRRTVLPGVRALLDRLSARDDAFVGLVTGNLEPGARAKLEALGLSGYFAEGGFASDHPDRREIARIAWRKASRRAGVDFPPGEVTVVGDTEYDVDCAKANGFRSIAVVSGWISRERLVAANPDHLLDDLTDLSATLAALGLD